MARRQQNSEFADIVFLTRLLPWWGGVLLALLSYGTLELYTMTASDVKLNTTQPGQVSSYILNQMLYMVANLAKYVLPILFLIGAALSFWQSRRPTKLYAGVANRGVSSGLDTMSWQDFELFTGEFFKRQGFEVTRRGGDGPDGGVDLELRMDGELYLVQCKHWRRQQIGVAVARELYGVVAATGAQGGFIVTSGSFTNEAANFAQNLPIDLIDAKLLAAEMRLAPPAQPKHHGAPDCPRCGTPMLLRTQKRGVNAGESFWGCANYPKCRGTRPR